MRRHYRLKIMHHVIALHHLAFVLHGALEHTSCLPNAHIPWPLLCKGNQLGLLLLLLLLFGNQNHPVILVIPVDYFARNSCRITPLRYTERDPSMP